MAHEPSEYTRYWGNCVGRLVLPKSRAPRLFLFTGVHAEPHQLAITPEMDVGLTIYSASGEWRGRTYTWQTFNEIAELFVPASQFINASLTAAYFDYSLVRQYKKGIETRAASDGLRLANLAVAPEEMWEAPMRGIDALQWQTYFINYGLPYPDFWDAYTALIEGRVLSRAFGRNYALFNLPDIKYPVLYVGTQQAGVVAQKAIHLIDSHSYAAPYLRKLTGMEVVIGKEKADEVSGRV